MQYYQYILSADHWRTLSSAFNVHLGRGFFQFFNIGGLAWINVDLEQARQCLSQRNVIVSDESRFSLSPEDNRMCM